MWFATKIAEENTIVLEIQTAPSGQLHQQPLQVVPDDFRSVIKHRSPSGSRSVRITDGETAAGLKADLGQRKNSFPPFLGTSHFYVMLAFKAKPKLADLCMIIFLCITPMNFTQWKVTRNIRWM